MIRFLVKFVSKEAYANDLLNGKLFMHCARYYHDIEKKYGPGQGDLREGSLFPNVAIYKNIYFPIYCMYMIKDEDIIDGNVIFDKRIIQDFNCAQGFLVVIPFGYFERVLPTADTGGFAMDGSEVRYGIPNKALVEAMITSEDASNLFIKHPFFMYQREYRLVVFKDIYKGCPPKSLQEEKTYTCCLANPIADQAKKVPISNLHETEAGFVLCLKDLFSGGQNDITT